jgi:hypothetical protein
MTDNTNGMTQEQMAARIAELEGRSAKGGGVSFEVSEKGSCLGVRVQVGTVRVPEIRNQNEGRQELRGERDQTRAISLAAGGPCCLQRS